jgi:Raf kinase inhibitor-like YbhB/YbcL family protein
MMLRLALCLIVLGSSWCFGCSRAADPAGAATNQAAAAPAAADAEAPKAEAAAETGDQEADGTMSFSIRSPSFDHDAVIPRRFTCQGEDLSPALAWSGAPEGTASFVLIVDDPDAPDPAAPKMTWVHWVLYNLPAASAGLGEGVAPEGLPSGSLQGSNDWKRTGYGGPCPPVGSHRYVFKLFALDVLLPDLASPTKAQLKSAMEGHVLARAELVGTYQKG